MGSFISRMLERIFDFSCEKRVLMLGLDAAGKTTILYKLQLGETLTTIPTIGFNVEQIKYKNVNFTVFDVGGQMKIRPLWRHYYHSCDALIWVVDASDESRFEEARDELHSCLQDEELRNAIILVYANKMDCPNAVQPNELIDRLSLDKLRGRMWYIQSSITTKGDGLVEGLEWLSSTLKKQK